MDWVEKRLACLLTISLTLSGILDLARYIEIKLAERKGRPYDLAYVYQVKESIVKGMMIRGILCLGALIAAARKRIAKKVDSGEKQNKDISDDKKEIKTEDNGKTTECQFAPEFFGPNSDEKIETITTENKDSLNDGKEITKENQENAEKATGIWSSQTGGDNIGDDILANCLMMPKVMILTPLVAIPYALYSIVRMAINCLKSQKNTKKIGTITAQKKDNSDDKKETKIEDGKKTPLKKQILTKSKTKIVPTLIKK